MKSAVLAVLTAALAGHAAAAIAKGVAYYTDGHSDQAVWLYGDSACDYVYMGPSDDDICAWNDGWFTAQNGYTCKYRYLWWCLCLMTPFMILLQTISTFEDSILLLLRG